MIPLENMIQFYIEFHNSIIQIAPLQGTAALTKRITLNRTCIFKTQKYQAHFSNVRKRKYRCVCKRNTNLEKYLGYLLK